MYVRLLCGEDSRQQVAALTSGRLEHSLKASQGVCRGVRQDKSHLSRRWNSFLAKV